MGDAEENLLVTAIRCEGNAPIEITVRQAVGAPLAGGGAELVDNGRPVNIGREQHGKGRWYFDGSIEDVRIEPRAFSAEEISALAKQRRAGEASKRFDGRSVFESLQAPRVEKDVTVSAWIKIEGVSKDANYIVSKGLWSRAYSLGLSAGCLRWAIGDTYAQTEKPLPKQQWLHVAGVFERGKGLELYVDGKPQTRSVPVVSATLDDRTATAWFTRRADDMPGSREVAVVTRILGADVRAKEGDGLQFMLKPGETVTLATVVRSDLDDKDFLATARKSAADLTGEKIDAVSARHLAWWREFWAHSFIEIPDKEIERRWYAALYTLASCSREGKVAPGLWGNWVTTDHPLWHGDYHLNYNFQAPYYMVYSSNHAELSLPFYQAIRESVPNGRAMAQRHGWKGVHFPVCIGPWGLLPEGPDLDCGQRSDAAFAALNFIWYYQYTQDIDFLRTTAYPYLREVAEFWEDYLKFEDGRYVIYRDSIHEGSGPDMNPLLSLGLLRTLFRNMLQISADLNVDADRRPKWQHICEHLSDYPLQERNGKTVFRYSEKGMAWCDGNTLGIHHIFPAGRNRAGQRPKTPGNLPQHDHGNGPLARRQRVLLVVHRLCPRGLRPPDDPHSASYRVRSPVLPNLVLQYGGGGIENASGFLAVNEMLLQSHEGVIRLFPVWPRAQDARFGGLRAVGALLVSAELKAGLVSRVRIHSEKGRDCTVENPWPGRKIQLVRNTKSAESMIGNRVTFKTAVGEDVALIPLL